MSRKFIDALEIGVGVAIAVFAGILIFKMMTPACASPLVDSHDTNNTQTTVSANTAAAASNASAANFNANVAKGGDADARANAHQGQLQGQSTFIEDRRDTASAFAASPGFGSEVCAMGYGVGGQGATFGFSVNFGDTEDGCERRRNAAMLAYFGDKEGALAVMCADEDVRAAKLAAGVPCVADRADRLPVEAPAPE